MTVIDDDRRHRGDATLLPEGFGAADLPNIRAGIQDRACGVHIQPHRGRQFQQYLVRAGIAAFAVIRAQQRMLEFALVALLPGPMQEPVRIKRIPHS